MVLKCTRSLKFEALLGHKQGLERVHRPIHGQGSEATTQLPRSLIPTATMPLSPRQVKLT